MSYSSVKQAFHRMLQTAWIHRHLIWQLSQRDILNKYRGSFAGLVWVFLLPLLMLGLYTLVFGVFLHLRWPGVDNSLIYSLIVYIGLIIFNFFSDCLTRSPGLIPSHANFVKKMIFPLEIYPFVMVTSALFYAFINTLILTVFCWLILGKVQLTMLWLPLLFLPLILLTLGCSWFLCSVGVYVRDISHAMGFIMQIIMYLSPVFYASVLLPTTFQKILLVNPLTFIIEQARNIVILGQALNWVPLSIYFLASLVIALAGFVWFQKTRDGFAEVL